MWRRELPTEMTAELVELDRALTGEPGVDPSTRQLVAQMQEARPRPEIGWAAELDVRVAREFAPAGAANGAASAPPPSDADSSRSGRLRQALLANRRRLLLAGGTGVSAAIALIVAVSLAGHGSGVQEASRAPRPTSAPNAGSSAAAPQARATNPRTLSKSASPPSVGQSSLAGPSSASGGARRVHSTVALTLASPAERMADAADGVVRVTDAFGGVVQSSSVNTGDAGQSGATFDLRLPADRLTAALDALSRLAHVRSRSQQTQDITRPFDDAQAAVADAAAARDALRRQLAVAATPDAAAALRVRLAWAEDRLGSARTQLEAIRRASDLVTVSVDIQPAASGTAMPGGGGWTLGDALRDALSVLSGAVGVTVVALAALLPAGIAIALAVLAAGHWRRRARERALRPREPSPR